MQHGRKHHIKTMVKTYKWKHMQNYKNDIKKSDMKHVQNLLDINNVQNDIKCE